MALLRVSGRRWSLAGDRAMTPGPTPASVAPAERLSKVCRMFVWVDDTLSTKFFAAQG